MVLTWIPTPRRFIQKWRTGSMKMRNCFGCGYHKMEKDSKGIPYHYCSDRDCKVDPHEPDCNYD